MNFEANVQKIQECYAAIALDQGIYATTSSGGVATVLSQCIIRENGVVYGASYKDYTVRHIRVDTMKGLEYLKGSKYVQSDLGPQQYYAIRHDLSQGKQVLFIGTPCQVAGLKSFLNKEYDNLLTVDLICHGTPPIKYLSEHLKALVGDVMISDVSFRIKDWKLQVHGKNSLLYSRINVEDYYCMAFAKNIIFRENCYKCLFAQPMRIADITIGDFWGIGKTNLSDRSKSVVLIMSNRGRRFWQICQTEFEFEKHDPQEAIAGNSQLRSPSNRPYKRDKFLDVYKRKGFRAGIAAAGIKGEVDLIRLKHRLCRKR